MKKEKTPQSLKKRSPFPIFIILLLAATVCAAGGVMSLLLLNRNQPLPVSTSNGRSLSEEGILITAVYPDTVAAEAGLQRGHILLALNGVNLHTRDDLQRRLGAAKAGDELNLTLWTGSQVRHLPVTLETDGLLGVNISGPTAVTDIGPDPLIPAAGRPTLPAAVSKIMPGLPAENAGLQVGDVITAVDGAAILSQQELAALIRSKTPGTAVTLTLRRGPDTFNAILELAPHPQNSSQGYIGVELQPPS